MLVSRRMSSPVITVSESTPIMEALDLMRRQNIRRTPVVNKKGKMIGIISDKDLLNAGPSEATSLSVWEVNYLLAKLLVKDVMTKDVLTVAEDTPIEEAAYIMAENKIGGLPVMRGEEIVGLITETDLFKIFLELLGARDEGVRVTALVPEKQGELDVLTHAISEAGGNFVSFGVFEGISSANKIVTFKVAGMSEAEVKDKIAPYINELIDIRTCCQ
ncbi:MAG: CBS domain-containing protein [Anaerolineales bacterium]|nr:CBS domain-containing protein [Anaerolineales bacterium]MCA9931748.1 CBS domain-containing protein [Anaerolineales bacterium]